MHGGLRGAMGFTSVRGDHIGRLQIPRDRPGLPIDARLASRLAVAGRRADERRIGVAEPRLVGRGLLRSRVVLRVPLLKRRRIPA